MEMEKTGTGAVWVGIITSLVLDIVSLRCLLRHPNRKPLDIQIWVKGQRSGLVLSILGGNLN